MEDKQLEEALAETIEKSFNDSELEDIMNEIENLEKEFSEDGSAADETGLQIDQKDNKLQAVIDQEVESIATEVDSSDAFEAACAEVASEEPAEQAVSGDAILFDDDDFNLDSDSSPEMTEAEEVVAQADEEITETISEPISETVLEQDTQPETQEDIMAAVEDQMEAAAIEMTAELEADTHASAETHQEPEMISEPVAEVNEVEAIEPAAETDNVFKFEKPSTEFAPTNKTPGSSSEMEFSASGTMDLNINLNIAGETANLKVENGGLTLQLSGVHLSITEEKGCSVTMEGGVEFSVPLKATNKKSNAA